MPRKEPVERRTISTLLQKAHGWSVRCSTDGKVRVAISGPRDHQQFAKEVRAAVEALGYAPRVFVQRREIVITTAVTLRQADGGRGVHGAEYVEPLEPQPVVRATAKAAPPKPHQAQVRNSVPKARVPLLTAAEVASVPWIRALRPIGEPFLETLSPHSAIQVWHVDVTFTTYIPQPDQSARWAVRELNVAETWQKRPLVVGEDSGCSYSCGEVELAARLRAAGFSSYWISEWSGFPHVACWEDFCVKRSELGQRSPLLEHRGRELRSHAEVYGFPLGTRGGHPDVIAWSDDDDVFYYIEYKGPGDAIRPKQNLYAQALVALYPDTLRYVAVKGAAYA